MTRYLCGASYVDPGFADNVVAELMTDAHRAVVPSTGYDLEPVLRHALRARRIWLAQHALVTLVLLIGFAFALEGTTLLYAGAVTLVLPGLLRRWLGRAKANTVMVLSLLFGGPLVLAAGAAWLVADRYRYSGAGHHAALRADRLDLVEGRLQHVGEDREVFAD
ncbi:hypothetical protein AB0H87_34720, partial [Asanoa sp. NPDC050611]